MMINEGAAIGRLAKIERSFAFPEGKSFVVACGNLILRCKMGLVANDRPCNINCSGMIS